MCSACNFPVSLFSDWRQLFQTMCPACNFPGSLFSDWHQMFQTINSACNFPVSLFSDWRQMFQTMCSACNFPIEPGDKWVEALSSNFHSECFNCSVSFTFLLKFDLLNVFIRNSLSQRTMMLINACKKSYLSKSFILGSAFV